MEIQALSFCLLYLTSVSVVRAIEYSGPKSVRVGEPWNITCKDIGSKKIAWTLNGIALSHGEFLDGSFSVDTTTSKDQSVLFARAAKEDHKGVYRCVSGGENSIKLSIITDYTYVVMLPTDTHVELECDATTKSQWEKDLEPLEESDHVKFQKGNIVINKYADEVFANYSCTNENVTTKYRVVPKADPRLEKSTTVTEGEKLHLTCNVGRWYPGVRVFWQLGDKVYNTSDPEARVELKEDSKGVPGANLDVFNITKEDRMNVTCFAGYNSVKTPDRFGNFTTLVRVKSKYAALWPFLCICAEVAILCAIILIYEKKRNKAELDESDTDQSPDTKPQNKDSDVRQRK